MDKLIFNTSMPKAGSELLQCILHQNPRIYGSVTSPVLEYQFGARGNYDLAEVKSQDPEIMHKAFINVCKAIPKAYYEEVTDRPVVCDKNRGWAHYYEWVAQWHEEPKMICMIRDLRSIIASFERTHRKHKHSPQSIDNPADMTNMTLDQRIDYWLNTQPVGLSLQRTYDLFQRGLDKNILFVKYEDLCADPAAVMEGIYAYIGEEDFDGHDFDNIQKTIKEDDSHFGIFGKHTVKPKITPVKSSNWEDVLSKDAANYIKNNHAWYFDTFQY
ncbi:sulfotransferase [bacterium]|nr:sulfotransferase [bacterium]